MTEQFIGETPEAVLPAFIDEYCRPNERETKTDSYQDRSIDPVTDETTATVASFSLTRREVSTRVVVREYEGSIVETGDGEYVIEHWETTVQSETRAPKPPGQTPQRLRGRRSRDRPK